MTPAKLIGLVISLPIWLGGWWGIWWIGHLCSRSWPLATDDPWFPWYFLPMVVTAGLWATFGWVIFKPFWEDQS